MIYTTLNISDDHIGTVALEEDNIDDYKERFVQALEDHLDAQIILDGWCDDIVSRIKYGNICKQRIVVGEDNQDTYDDIVEIKQTWLY